MTTQITMTDWCFEVYQDCECNPEGCQGEVSFIGDKWEFEASCDSCKCESSGDNFP